EYPQGKRHALLDVIDKGIRAQTAMMRLKSQLLDAIKPDLLHPGTKEHEHPGAHRARHHQPGDRAQDPLVRSLEEPPGNSCQGDQGECPADVFHPAGNSVYSRQHLGDSSPAPAPPALASSRPWISWRERDDARRPRRWRYQADRPPYCTGWRRALWTRAADAGAAACSAVPPSSPQASTAKPRSSISWTAAVLPVSAACTNACGPASARWPGSPGSAASCRALRRWSARRQVDRNQSMPVLSSRAP